MADAKDARGLQIFDPVLSNVARNHRFHGGVYDQIVNAQQVATDSGQYPIFDEAYFFGDDTDNKASDRAQTQEIDLVYSLDNYLAEEYRLKVSISRRERRQAVDQLRLEQSKLNLLLDRMAIRRERRIAAVLRATGSGGQLNLSGAATAAFSGSTAIEADWKTAKIAVYNKTGMVPNVAVVPYLKAYDMATNTTLRDIFKYQINGDNFISLGGGAGGEQLILPQVFHGTRLVIPQGALYNSAREGATKSLSEIWGSSVRFLYVDPSASWGAPSTVYSFQSQPRLVDRWTELDPPVDYIRAWEFVDEKVCAPDLGYELTGC